MEKLLLMVCFVYLANAFLFDTSTTGQTGGLMTDNHYDYLLKLFMDESNSRRQLQDILTRLVRRVEKLENTIATSQNAPTNDTFITNERYAHLDGKYSQLQQNHLRLEKMVEASENRSKQLEEEITSLKQVSAINQLQTLSNLETQLQDVKHNLSSVIAENQAHGQDLVSIYKDLGSVKQDYALFEYNTTETITDLQKVQLVLSSQINQTMQELSEEVGFTAFGRSSGSKSYGETLLFPDIKSSFGISDLSTFTSTGKFTCEKEGLYFVSVTVTSCSTADSVFFIYKNDAVLAPYYIGRPETSNNTNCNSGTGTILIQLNVSNNVFVKVLFYDMTVFDQWSSFTVTKLK